MTENNQHKENIAVLTVATKPDAYFKAMLESCNRQDITPTVLGMGTPWRGWCTKLNLVYRHITQAGSKPYTLYADAYDTIFQAGLADIWESYQGFNSPLVVSVDMQCWPDASIKDRFPPSPTKGRYVNAGCFMGETKALVRALEVMGCPFKDENQDDQGLMNVYFLSHRHEMKLDYYFEIFQTLFWAEDEVEFKRDEKHYINRRTKKRPHILHLNGLTHRLINGGPYLKNLGYTP